MQKQSIETFAEIVNQFSLSKIHQLNKRYYTPVFNISFFLGAGFSKSWDTRYPTGSQLFDFKNRNKDSEIIAVFSRVRGNKILERLTVKDSNTPHSYDYRYKDIKDINKISDFLKLKDKNIVQLPDRFREFLALEHYNFDLLELKDVIYHLSMQLKYPDLRSRHMDTQNIQLIMNEVKYFIHQRFEQLSGVNYFSEELQRFPVPDIPSADQVTILKFFDYFISNKYSSGSNGIHEGVRCNFITTNYDFLIETILDTILRQKEDTIFHYAYRGITPELINGSSNQILNNNHWMLYNLIKINGGFEILASENSYHFDYRKRQDSDILKNPPKIMLPNQEQDYTDPYFKEIFPKAVRLLQESQVLVIVGYSMPEEDSLIKILLKQFAETREDFIFKYIFYITGSRKKNGNNEEDYKKLKQKIFNLYPYFNKNEDDSSILIYPGHFCDWANGVIQKLEELSLER